MLSRILHEDKRIPFGSRRPCKCPPPIAISGETAVVSFQEHRFPKTVPGYQPLFLLYSTIYQKMRHLLGAGPPGVRAEANTVRNTRDTCTQPPGHLHTRPAMCTKLNDPLPPGRTLSRPVSPRRPTPPPSQPPTPLVHPGAHWRRIQTACSSTNLLILSNSSAFTSSGTVAGQHTHTQY